MSDYEKFKQSVETASNKIAWIAQQTLQENVKVAKHRLNGTHVKPPFCRYAGACDEKKLRMVYYSRGVKRRYQLCKSANGCSQRTVEAMYYEVP